MLHITPHVRSRNFYGGSCSVRRCCIAGKNAFFLSLLSSFWPVFMHFYASTHALRPEQARLRTTNAESHYFFSSGWSDWSCCGCTLPVLFLNGVDGSSAKTSSSKHMDWKLLFFKGQFPHRRFNPPKKMGVGQVQAFFAAIFFLKWILRMHLCGLPFFLSPSEASGLFRDSSEDAECRRRLCLFFLLAVCLVALPPSFPSVPSPLLLHCFQMKEVLPTR